MAHLPLINVEPDPAKGGPWRNIFQGFAAADIPERFDVQNRNSGEHEGDDILVQCGTDPNTPPSADDYDGERVRPTHATRLAGETVVWVRCPLPRSVKVQVLVVE